MKVVLFIGHHKVGSSSLQRFLSQNYLALLRAGILYPSVESQGFSHNIAAALRGRDCDSTLPINAREAHNALAFRMMSEVTGRKLPPFHKHLPRSGQMFVALGEQVDTLAPEAVILCAEVFSNFGKVAPDQIERLERFFSGSDMRILCTLRRPDDYLVSWHGQRLKFGQKLFPLRAEGLEKYYDTIHFDYRTMLEGWTEVFSDAEFIVQDYQDILEGGGSVDGLLRDSGIEFPADLKRFDDSNPSIPRALMEIARRANHALDRHDATIFREYLVGLSGHAALPKNSDVEMFGAENRAALVRNFAPIAAFLSGRNGREVFFAGQQDLARLRPIPEETAAQSGLELVKKDAPKQRLGDEIDDFVKSLEL